VTRENVMRENVIRENVMRETFFVFKGELRRET